MNNFSLDSVDKSKPIFFIGIGGISMSALAVILKNDGFSVCGSDFKESDMTADLRRQGIDVSIGHSADNIGDVSLVVYTAAIQESNPELVKARSMDIPVIERAVLLGAIMKRYKNPIAVSGTHGKTTTTSMLSHILLSANLDPTILVGGVLPIIGGNMRDGGNDYLVTEACEYTGSFLKFHPLYSIILNIEEDHLDYFKDINDIVKCFRKFAEITPKNGAVIANFDDNDVRKVTDGLACRVVSYGIDSADADYTARNIRFTSNDFGTFDVFANGVFFMNVALRVPGLHNVSNALAVIAVAALLGVDKASIQKGFESFSGTNRRFERKGLCRGAKIIDDYAHHPTEIKTTLRAAREVAKGKEVWCVFQPHTYTRALKLKNEFAQSFGDCDHVIVADIYAAREKDTGLIHSRDLADAINSFSHNAMYMKEFSEIAQYLQEHIREGDLVLTMGAGDVYKIGESMVKQN